MTVLLVIATTLLATNHLTRRIDKANAQREEMFGAFMRSAKLASVGELATGLAHEINNPLAIISVEETNLRDLINTLDESSEDRPEMLSSLNSIKHQIKRCANITTKMLQFGRKSETKLEPTEIGPRLKEIVELLQRQASVRNVELILEVEKDLPLAVADPLELEQVLVNLINNSFYALPDGGRVTITCKRSEANLQIEVEDNGTGMPEEILDRIFEPFFPAI